MTDLPPRVELELPPLSNISWTHSEEPLRFYYWPIVGRLYRARYEYCLGQCNGGHRVLEVGYGSGLALSKLHEMYDEVYGLDLLTNASEAMTSFKELGLNVALTNGSILDMPYEDAYFDTVLAISLLEHLQPEKLSRAMQEIGRLLKNEKTNSGSRTSIRSGPVY